MIDHPSSNETTLLTYPKPESNKSDTVQKFNPSHTDVVGEKIAEQAFSKQLWKINRGKERANTTSPPFKTNV